MYPTLASASVSYDVITSTAAQFVADQGWTRVATLTPLANEAVADAARFAKAAASFGITVALRETFDESQASNPPADDGSWSNPSLDAAVARLRMSNVRIIFLSCTGLLQYGILTALDRAGMIGPSYVYLGDMCLNSLAYSAVALTMPASRKAHLLSGVIPVQANTFIPQDPKRVSDFYVHLTKLYQDAPEALFSCDPQVPISATVMTLGYERAITAMRGLHLLEQQKQLCQQPSNQQKLEQALPLQQAKQLGSKFDCVTAMKPSSWNTSLAIDCCRLDPARSPYIRPPSPFGDESYVNGDGPVLLDMLRSVRMDGITGPIGIQTPESPIASVVVSNYLVNLDTGSVKITPRLIYRTNSCNTTSNLCTWNITRISPFTYGDGATVTPDDGVIRYVATLNPSSIGRGIFVGLSTLGLLMIGVVSVLMWRYRGLKSIKSSSITFVMLILFAASAALSTVISLYHDDSVASCQARVWMGHLSFAVLFGSLLLKTYRLAHIFDNRALRVKAKSDLDLLGLLSIYVVVVCALLISWMVRHAPTVVFKIRSDGRAGYYTCESGSYTEMWALLGVHGAGLVWGIYLCVKSQDVFAELNESKQIALSIYNVAMVSALIVAIDQGLNYYHVDITFYIYAAGIILGAGTTVPLLVTPKIINIYREYVNKTEYVRPQHTKGSSGGGSGPNADLSKSGKEKRLSLGPSVTTAAANTLDSMRVTTSDLGLGVTPTDWMKLNVFTRKCYEATNNNNIGRLIMEQNKVFALLAQIYKDSIQGNRDKSDTTTVTDTAYATTNPNPLTISQPKSNLAGFHRHRHRDSTSSSDVGPYDVNENGVRINMMGTAELQDLFHMQANQTAQQRTQPHQHINKHTNAGATAAFARNSIIDTTHAPVDIHSDPMSPCGAPPTELVVQPQAHTQGQPNVPSGLVEPDLGSGSFSELTSLSATNGGGLGYGHERPRSSSVLESQHELEPVEQHHRHISPLQRI